jgi:hypothetical protein
MWATLALASSLSLAPGQAGDLKLSNVRTTYGILGQERLDADVLPGDLLFVSFDIENLKVADDGKIEYSIGLELINKKDKKVVYTQEPEDAVAINSLGTSKRPAFALTQVNLDTPAGDYTLNVTVADRSKGGKKATITKDFKVLPLKFGITRVGYTYEGSGLPAPALAVPGQTFVISFAVVGFETKTPKGVTDTKVKQPNLDLEMIIYDADNKPTVPKPFTFSVTDVKEEYKRLVPMLFTAQLNRPGKFTIKIKAIDRNNSDKTTEQTLKLTVLGQP